MVHGGCVAAEADRERMDNSSGPNTLKYFLDILVCPRSVRNCPRVSAAKTACPRAPCPRADILVFWMSADVHGSIRRRERSKHLCPRVRDLSTVLFAS